MTDSGRLKFTPLPPLAGGLPRKGGGNDFPRWRSYRVRETVDRFLTDGGVDPGFEVKSN